MKNYNTDWCKWFVGFTDGEGCFSIALQKRTTQKYQTFQVNTIFSIGQAEENIIKEIHNVLNFGFYTKLKKKKYYERLSRGFPECKTWYCATKSLQDCLKLIKIFDKYKLKTKKLKDYEYWREVVMMRKNNNHKKWQEKDLKKIKKIIYEKKQL